MTTTNNNSGFDIFPAPLDRRHDAFSNNDSDMDCDSDFDSVLNLGIPATQPFPHQSMLHLTRKQSGR